MSEGTNRHIVVVDSYESDIFIAERIIQKYSSRMQVDFYSSHKNILQDIMGGMVRPDLLFFEIEMHEMDAGIFLNYLERIVQSIQVNLKCFVLTSSLDQALMLKVKSCSCIQEVFHKPLSNKILSKALQVIAPVHSANSQDTEPTTIPSPHEEDPIEHIYQKVIDLLENGLHVQKPGLTLHDLARLVGTNHLYLSNAINQYSGHNFNGLINMYRVQFAQKILSNPEHRDLPILKVGTMSGFPSINTFFRQFKLITGETPLYYKRISLKRVRDDD
jgi:AraC-like DNA-binding protein/CheY-like chemotaxis protein